MDDDMGSIPKWLSAGRLARSAGAQPRATLLLTALALIGLLGAGCSSEPMAGGAKPPPIPVIFDTDIGDDIDDTWALGFLLRSPELDLKLAVGDNGKAEYRAKLLARFLEVAGRGDVSVGVGLDLNAKTSQRQAEWVKGYDLNRYPGKVHRDGVQNIAEALKREPRLAERARFVGMHGSVRVGYGGNKKIAAEYNVKLAPQACQTVFAAPWDATITPLDTCDQLGLRGEKYQRVYQSSDPVAAAIITNYRLWATARGQGSSEAVPTHSTTLFDAVAVYLAFSQEWCGMERLGIRVTDEGFTIEDPAARKLNVAMTWKNLPALEDLLFQRLTNAQ
jgi:inosine-uridine nucleoside N-ribohydrolase